MDRTAPETVAVRPAAVRVLHVIRPANLTGAPAAMLELIRALESSQAVKPTVACGIAEGLPEALQGIGVRVVICRDLIRKPAPWRDLKALWFLWRTMRREQFDIVHTHSSKAGILGRWAAYMAGVPACVHTFHGLPWLGNSLFEWIEGLTSVITDGLIVLSESDRLRLEASPAFRRGRVRLIANGLRIEPYTTLRERAVGARTMASHSGRVVIGTAARWRPPKRPDLFVRMAFEISKRCPGCRFVIAGDGPLLAQTEGLAEELGIRDSVDFLGWQEDIRPLLAGLDVFVLTSDWEGLPVALIEAALTGVPTVASDVRGNRDVIENEKTGLLAQSTPADLADAVERLLADRQLAARLADQARSRAIESFDIRTTARATFDLYREVLSLDR